MIDRGLHRIREIPTYDSGNAWYNLLPEPDPPLRLTGEVFGDWTILGAGACGLATARRLADLRPDDRIVVVEASRVGYGASGRNAGFMLNHNTHGESKDLAIERRNGRLCQGGHDYLATLVEMHQIRCNWSDWGRVYAAAGDDADAHLSALSRVYDELLQPWTLLDAADMARLTGSAFYRSGLRARGNGLVNPAAMVRGLAACLPENVTLYEESPIVSVAVDRPHRLQGEEGEVFAPGLILATSVFLEDMGICRHRIVPIATFASLSKPVPPALRASLGEDGEFALLPAHPNGSTVRLDRDGRLLMRNTIRYARGKRFDTASLSRISDVHRAAIAARWPALEGLEFEGTWGGMLGFTRNDGTIWGHLGANVHAVISSDAAPMTRGTMAGKLVAENICGEDSDLLALMRSIPSAARLPPDPLLRIAVQARIWSDRWTGKGEI